VQEKNKIFLKKVAKKFGGLKKTVVSLRYQNDIKQKSYRAKRKEVIVR